MTPLPIDAVLPEILATLRGHRSLVLVAPPGSGKTTRVPPAVLKAGLLDASHPALILLQPRRVAARAAAYRIGEENGWEVGREVGYQVRLERRIGPSTRLRVETEGVLNRQLVADPFLEGVGAVVLDEFHERSLHTDLAIALLREVRETVRDDLILIVMSATLDAEPVARFLGGCPIIQTPARTHPVTVTYRPTAKPSSAESVAEAVSEVLNEPEDAGHVLVFLPGVEEIRRASAKLEPLARQEDFAVLPLHGSLPAEDQDRALRPSERRKVVLATNLAETSLTIDGVRTVIDSGLARFASVDPARGLDRLELGRISKASADQRAGRAGRTAPGRCVRLWSERETRGMAESDPPEIARVDLASTLLALHAWGSSDPLRFDWFETPPEERSRAAESLLVSLGALDSSRTITALGRLLLSVPAHPRIARLLVAASAEGFPRAGATLVALLSERDVVPPASRTEGARTRARGNSDLLDRIELLEVAEAHGFRATLRGQGIDPRAARHVARVRDDLLRTARRLPGGRVVESETPDDTLMLRWILRAYPDRVTRRRGSEATGVMVGGRGIRLEPESVVREAEFFLSLDPREDRRRGAREARVRIASAIEVEWLDEFFPGEIRAERSVSFDAERQRVVRVSSVWYRDLPLREDRDPKVDAREASEALAAALRPLAPGLLREDEAAALWLARLEFLRRAVPEGEWPEFDDETLASVVADACAGRRTLAEVREAPWVPLLRARLTHAQARELDEQAPESLLVPSGSRIRLSYEPGRPPVLAVRLQELFGWTETPRLARGRVAVVLRLLGPNYRPVQVTDDLPSFWTSTYFQVRKDLRARYPRHSWPDDPRTARPQAKGGLRSEAPGT
ncbi:MAG: ATP-dependent helicase HrpB [Isosphaeraceae bacterium]